MALVVALIRGRCRRSCGFPLLAGRRFGLFFGLFLADLAVLLLGTLANVRNQRTLFLFLTEWARFFLRVGLLRALQFFCGNASGV